MCHALGELMAEFYREPENERRYREWLEERRGAPMPGSDARAPKASASGRGGL